IVAAPADLRARATAGRARPHVRFFDGLAALRQDLAFDHGARVDLPHDAGDRVVFVARLVAVAADRRLVLAGQHALGPEQAVGLGAQLDPALRRLLAQ